MEGVTVDVERQHRRMRRSPALVHETNEAVERRVRALEVKDALDLGAVEQAVGRIERPEVLVDRLAASIRYSQRVEAEVADLGIETLLPYATDDYDARFLEVWVPDERGHGAGLEMLLDALGLPTYVARAADTVPLHNRLAGRLGRLTAHAYEVVSLTYHSIGAMNERLAMAAYTRMAEICREGTGDDDPGLTAVADTLLTPMRRDESLHLGYYRTYARQLRQQLAPWKVALVRLLVVHTYAPVGAGLEPDKGPLGEVLLELEDDPDDPATARMVQAVAEELLAAPGRELPQFVRSELLSCLELARRAPQAPQARQARQSRIL